MASVAGSRCRDHAEAAGDGDLGSVPQRRSDRPQDPIGDQPHVVGLVELAAEHYEFIASQPCNRVRSPRHSLQTSRDIGKYSVARLVTKRVVDHLEVVKVDEQQPDPPGWRSSVTSAWPRRSINATRFASPVTGSCNA